MFARRKGVCFKLITKGRNGFDCVNMLSWFFKVLDETNFEVYRDLYTAGFLSVCSEYPFCEVNQCRTVERDKVNSEKFPRSLKSVFPLNGQIMGC